ncbi:acyltransferase [Pseudoalteromonas sp. R86517]|uniref:acyltransferase n=1 Tax=Pseudoalteromonas sp. R86517 TaxID=3093857 RepID=UPI003671F5AD
MKNKLALTFYYSFIYHLPNTKFLPVFNRFRVWYLSKILKVLEPHPETIFENGVYISNGKSISIGRHCHINERVFIQGAKIGNFVMIAPDVSILNNSHMYADTKIPMIKQKLIKDSNPIIEDDVWIGRNVVILHGITIGKGSIIGAGSVVTKNVEPFSIMGGVPAKKIKSRLPIGEI